MEAPQALRESLYPILLETRYRSHVIMIHHWRQLPLPPNQKVMHAFQYASTPTFPPICLPFPCFLFILFSAYAARWERGMIGVGLGRCRAPRCLLCSSLEDLNKAFIHPAGWGHCHWGMNQSRLGGPAMASQVQIGHVIGRGMSWDWWCVIPLLHTHKKEKKVGPEGKQSPPSYLRPRSASKGMHV